MLYKFCVQMNTPQTMLVGLELQNCAGSLFCGSLCTQKKRRSSAFLKMHRVVCPTFCPPAAHRTTQNTWKLELIPNHSIQMN